MPTWLAWNVIKGPLLKVAPWIGLALALLIGWHTVAVHYRAQGRAESAAVIAGDRIAMQRGIDAINALRGALRRQNEAIDSLKADGDARARFALAQRDAALKANKALSDQARVLRSSASRHYSSAEPCTSSAALMSAKDL
jgi:hypothetical protein